MRMVVRLSLQDVQHILNNSSVSITQLRNNVYGILVQIHAEWLLVPMLLRHTLLMLPVLHILVHALWVMEVVV